MSDNAPALRPPPEYAHLRWHWIKQASGELIVMAWTISNKWADHVGFLSPEAAWGQLWRYHGPCTPTAIVPASAAEGTRKDSLRVEPNADLTTPNAEIERLKAEVKDLEPYVAANAALLNENERQRAALAICVGALTVSATDHQKSARQFKFYVLSHLAKIPPDSEKAVTNNDHLVRCTDAAEAALNVARDAAGGKDGL